MEPRKKIKLKIVKDQKNEPKKYMNEYMESLIKLIKEDIFKEYPSSDQKGFYIYTRYNQKRLLFKIFVSLLKNSRSNDRDIDIDFLISINEQFPLKAPKVFCISYFITTADIFDMRNIQQSLILNWTSRNKISDLIKKLPSFCYSFEYQVNQGMFPNVGEYYLFSYKYDINEFLLNINNIVFKVKMPTSVKSGLILRDAYLLITSTNIIILEPVDNKSKNICVINYVGPLIGIEKLEKINNYNDLYKDYYCFKIIWNKKVNEIFQNALCINNQNKDDIIDVNDSLLGRRDIINNNFKLIEQSQNFEINAYEQMIQIKQQIIENEYNDVIYDDIIRLYRKIIEIASTYNNEGFQIYLDKLHNFIETYNKKKDEN